MVSVLKAMLAKTISVSAIPVGSLRTATSAFPIGNAPTRPLMLVTCPMSVSADPMSPIQRVCAPMSTSTSPMPQEPLQSRPEFDDHD
jgi:hypothetical protein